MVGSGDHFYFCIGEFFTHQFQVVLPVYRAVIITLDDEYARNPVDERRHDAEDGAHEHEEPAPDERLPQL